MSRRARSPFAGMPRVEIEALRYSVKAARKWASKLGTPRQELRPSPLDVLEFLPLSYAIPDRFRECVDRAEARAVAAMSTEDRDRANRRAAELHEARYYPERARAREAAAARTELAALRARVELLEAERA